MANQPPQAGVDPQLVQQVIQDASMMEQEGQTRVMISRQLFQQLQAALQTYYGNSKQVDKMFETEEELTYFSDRLNDMIELAVVARYKIPDYIIRNQGTKTTRPTKSLAEMRKPRPKTTRPTKSLAEMRKPRPAKKATIDDFRDQAPRRKAKRARKTDRAASQIEKDSKDPSLGFLEAKLDDAIEFGSGGIARLGRKAKGLLKNQRRAQAGGWKKRAERISAARGEALGRKKGREISRPKTHSGPRTKGSPRQFKKPQAGSTRDVYSEQSARRNTKIATWSRLRKGPPKGYSPPRYGTAASPAIEGVLGRIEKYLA